MRWDEDKAMNVTLATSAAAGALAGAILGFLAAGVGGAILGVIVGPIVGWFVGGVLFVLCAALPELLGEVVVPILFWIFIIWLICHLWGVGKPT